MKAKTGDIKKKNSRGALKKDRKLQNKNSYSKGRKKGKNERGRISAISGSSLERGGS